ncbi:hypothetical protein QJS04_geneDACA009576 [Acorus gramineus]|uniref:Uncharacterized protein n=1 Tax=Acorus gramineus TaxID=55184 RepID=A0AAV9B7M1_ACOGR|nr:hypothetical protein QJS04_geneDACA009576 [Acorus gramineus]
MTVRKNSNPLKTHPPQTVLLSLPTPSLQPKLLHFFFLLMETPSSTRRVTRSQTGALASDLGSLDFHYFGSFSSCDRSCAGNNSLAKMALVDVTNDSPIVGVALTGSLKTPSSAAFAKSRGRPKNTPSSGEALLRGQVKSLLQKVEEEAHLFVRSGSNEGTIDELCDGLKTMAVRGGRHVRFIYNSDDEIEGEEVSDVSGSPNVLRLKGLPTPKGKHLRFPDDDDGES